MEAQSSLVLASASPRRREILEALGFEFEVLPVSVDEEKVLWDDPAHGARLLAELKAVEARRVRPRKTIIAADTVVVCMGRRLGKPADAAGACEMLEILSNREHEVITGIALSAPPNRCSIEVERTKVQFRELERGEIDRYIETNEPFDKAGAYAIQGYASIFINKIEGCYFNVVGLPVARLFKMLKLLER
ncbi:MAG: septum formation protein Maf [Candidatus Krumholzibacteria bacterium]|nr:septum formation protein Maf [Candidatus Krumholzibacteria bacterium]